MMGWPFLHLDFLHWTVDMYSQKKKKKKELLSQLPRIASQDRTVSPNHSLAEGHWFSTDHCLQSAALILSVPCSPMSMVSSVDQVDGYQVCSHPASVCLVDRVLHGDCPDVMTLGSQQRTVAYYTRGE